ncbi:MAG: DUF134 domain-containing protein [bacterium]
MPRHRIRRCLRFKPQVYYYKPQGVPLRHLEEVVLERDELEALKLKEVDNLLQEKAAQKMGISQPTFQRTLTSARKKVALAIIKGMAIRVEK